MVNRILILLLVSLGVSAFAATGDVKSAQVETNGWVLDITFDTMPTNSAFNFNWSTNNLTGSKVVLVVSSPGYATNGNVTASTRIIYGTKQLRFPYGTGGQTTVNFINDVQASGADAVSRIALSDYVFASDTIVGLRVDSGFYGANNANVNVTTVNASTQAYPNTVGKFTQPNYDRITNNTYYVHAVAFNHFGQNGRPVNAIRFWAQDAHSHFYTNIVTAWTIDPAMGDAVPVVEAVAQMDASGFTQGDIITNNFQALPWVGDTNSILDTSDGKFTTGDPYWHPLYMLCDSANTYGSVYAYVKQSTGTANGKAVTTNWNVGAEPAAFASISQAAHAIEGTNNALYSHNDSGGGFIQCDGNVSFSGTDASASTTAGKTWLTIRPAPGKTATIVDGTGPGNVNNRTKLSGITITSADAFTFGAVSNLWFDQCTFNVTSSANDLVDGSGYHWATRCVVSNFDQGFEHAGGDSTLYEIVRGNWFYGQSGVTTSPYCIIGNYRNSSINNRVFTGTDYSGIPRSAQSIVIAFNKFIATSNNSSAFFSFYSSTSCTNGAVFAQNLIEYIGINTGDVLLQFKGDGNSNHATNVMEINNTVVGGKWNNGYDDLGSVPHYASCWLSANNLASAKFIKSDTFSGNSLNGNRNGNWPLIWGVACYGDADLQSGGGYPIGSFWKEFIGIGGYQPGLAVGYSQPPSGVANATNYPRFVNDQSYNGQASPQGNGDYHLQSWGPVQSYYRGAFILPYDIDGNTRGAYDPPGCYSIANPRRSF